MLTATSSSASAKAVSIVPIVTKRRRCVERTASQAVSEVHRSRQPRQSHQRGQAGESKPVSTPPEAPAQRDHLANHPSLDVAREAPLSWSDVHSKAKVDHAVTGQVDAVRRLAQQILDLHPSQPLSRVLQGQSLQGREITRVLKFLGKRGQRHKALKAFEWMDRHRDSFETQDPFLYSQLMQMFSKKSTDCATALRLFDSMPARGVKPDLVVFNAAINAAGKARDWNRVMQIFDTIQDNKLEPDVWTFTSIINACQTCGNDWQTGLDVFGDMESYGIEPNAHAYSAIMSLCQKAGQWQRAMQIFREMEAVDVRIDVVAYNSAIAACSKGSDWEQAWAVFNSMRRAGVQPDSWSFNSLMSACERCGEAERALEVFSMMEREAVRMHGFIKPNLYTYNTLISGCGKAGMYLDVKRLYGDMLDKQIQGDVFTMCGIITACEKVGEWQEAVTILQELQAQGVQPNTAAYNALIKAFGTGLQFHAAVAVFERMQTCAAEDPKSCCPPDLVTYTNIVSACRESKQWQKALEIYEGMKAAGIEPNSYVYSSVIAACEDSNRWSEALAVFSDMKDSSIALDYVAMAGRNLMYKFPEVLTAMPDPLVIAAKLAVKSGRAARQWMSPS